MPTGERVQRSVIRPTDGLGQFDLRKCGQYPQTVVRMWRYGSDRGPGTAPVSVERQRYRVRGNTPESGARTARRDDRGQGQADLPAEQPSAGKGSWFPAADAHPCRPGDRCRSSSQGPSLADCLTYRSLGVLPARYRMTRSADFGTTVKQGVRAVQPDLVVHVRRVPDSADGPQIGFVVTKAIGGAVDRHRVARRLRHLIGAVLSDLEPTDRIVVRALPGSRSAKTQRLQQELSAALLKGRQLIEQGR